MANIGATFSMIAISVIFIVAIIGVFQIQSFQSHYNSAFKDIVDQLNTAQQKEIDFDRRSKQRVNTVVNDASTFNSSFVTNDAVAKGVSSQSLNVYGTLKADKNSVQANDIIFSSRWSGFPNQSPNQAFISNDTELNKKLMIVGNKSDGSGQRKVGVWDKLDVHGNLGIDKISSAHSVIGRERVGGENVYMDKDGNIFSSSLIEGESIQGRDSISVGNGAAYMQKDGTVYANKNLISQSTIDGQNIVGKNMVKVSNDSAWMKNDGTFSGKQVCLGGTCINKTELQKIKDMSSATDCQVSNWTPWSLCTNPCGGGTQYRIRNVSKAAMNGGQACPSLIENQQCNKQACGVDCVVSAWSAWSTCTRTCGGGSRSRTRTVISQPQNGGLACPELIQYEICNPDPCTGPVPCVMSDWSEYGACTKTCGGGTRTRTRYATQQPLNGGTPCGPDREEAPCNTNPCPVDCVMGSWGDWGNCSVVCGGGTQTRTRSVVTQPANGGVECPKNPDGQIFLNDTQSCNTQACGYILTNVQPWNGKYSSSGSSSAHSVIINSSGQVYTWGLNGNFQLGDRTTTNRSLPTLISGFTNPIAIASGYYHNLLLTAAGILYAWGHNGNGRLGDGTNTDRSSAVVIGSILNGVNIACGFHHSVAITKTGQLYAWGYNGYGQLGNNATGDRWLPTLITGISNVAGVSCGFYHTVAFTTSGQLYAWGYNPHGNLGDNTTIQRIAPTLISGVSNVVAIACGEYHTMALTSAGELYTWGLNSNGQLGTGNTTQRITPGTIAISGMSGSIIQIACGRYSSYVVTSSGQLFAWGGNGSGQLGDGTTTNRLSPTLITRITNVASISCGQQHVIATTISNRVVSWGLNSSGQLGDTTLTQRNSPVQIFEYSFRLSWIDFNTQAFANNGRVVCFVNFAARQIDTVTVSQIPSVDYAVSTDPSLFTSKFFEALWGTGNIGQLVRTGSSQPGGTFARGTPTPTTISFSPNASISWFVLMYNFDVTSASSNPVLSKASFANLVISV